MKSAEKSWTGEQRIFLFVAVLLFLAGCAAISPASREIDGVLADARKAVKNDNYKNACLKYIDAAVKAENTLPERVKPIRKELAKTYIQWSRSLYWKAKTENTPEFFEKAIFICGKAAEVYPKYKGKCGNYIDKFRRELASLKYSNLTSVKNIIPDQEERNYNIALLFRQGRELESEGMYGRAKEKYEGVLNLDPFSIEGTRALRRVLKKIAEAGSERAKTEEIARMAEVEWKNVEPTAAKASAAESAARDAEAGMKMRDEMSGVILVGSVNFKDTPLPKVFSKLEKVISGRLGRKIKIECRGFSPSDKKFPLITFKADKIPADAAVNNVCTPLKLTAQYAKNRIIIIPTGE